MKTIEDISSLSNAIKRHQYYRASLLSANLIESGYSSEQVMILRRTAEGRNALQDIEDITVKYPYLNPDRPYIEIESGRAGIYDAMPEGLFFAAGDSGRERDKRQIIERIRGNRELEKYIRQFMHLFEVESDSLRTQIDVEELKYDKCRVYRHLPEFYAQYWSVFSLMSTGEVLRMLKVIPYIPSLQDDLQGAAKAISFILNLRVTVEKRLTEIVSQEDTTPILSELRLGGRIINISSTRYLMSEPGSEAYAASKGGIYALTHALALSLADLHITVNSIAPGWIQNHDYDRLRPEDHAQHPSRRVGRPEDIARTCLFLCQDENNFINGENITIDGGMTKKMIYTE